MSEKLLRQIQVHLFFFFFLFFPLFFPCLFLIAVSSSEKGLSGEKDLKELHDMLKKVDQFGKSGKDIDSALSQLDAKRETLFRFCGGLGLFG